MLKVRSCRVISQRRIWWPRDHREPGILWTCRRPCLVSESQDNSGKIIKQTLSRFLNVTQVIVVCHRRVGPRELWMESHVDDLFKKCEHHDVFDAAAIKSAELTCSIVPVIGLADGLVPSQHPKGGSTKPISDVARTTCEFLLPRNAAELQRLGKHRDDNNDEPLDKTAQRPC